MTNYAIRVEELCKEYVIGGRERTNRTFRESLTDAISAPLRHLRAIGQEIPAEERFWALQDVSFDVKPGEVLGIIGRNGAGKSTLLKVLSRITAPTRGRVEIRGRVGSLLEVGTGFHSELTGRENIYLNGAILGMSRAEITRKFDDIVAFSGVERFLDTPVKRYSSGMYVRLAFAVAAHLEPEILIVDEVLAVGDAEFQKKCLGKMGSVAQEGRTVVLVSHNLAAVASLCEQALWIEAGRLATRGPIAVVLPLYRAEHVETLDKGFSAARRRVSSPDCRIVDAWLAVNGQRTNQLAWNASFDIVLDVEVIHSVKLSPEYLIRDHKKAPVLFSPTGLHQGISLELAPGRHRITATCAAMPLASGVYYFDLMLAESGVRFFDQCECALRIEVPDWYRSPHNWRYTQEQGQGLLPFGVKLHTQRLVNCSAPAHP